MVICISAFPCFVDQLTNLLGHQFERRYGHANRAYYDEQRAPIFQQFLDCVFQILSQFPTEFEFNERFLLEISHHVISLRFGTFLGNNDQDRNIENVKKRTVSLWSYLNGQASLYLNPFYSPENNVILVSPAIPHLKFWSNYFLQNNKRQQFLFNHQNQSDFVIKKWKNDAQALAEQNQQLQKEIDQLRAQLHR